MSKTRNKTFADILKQVRGAPVRPNQHHADRRKEALRRECRKPVRNWEE